MLVQNDLTNIRYADDIVLIGKSSQEIAEMMDMLVETLHGAGFELNVNKNNGPGNGGGASHRNVPRDKLWICSSTSRQRLAQVFGSLLQR